MSRTHRFGSVSLIAVLGWACSSLPATPATKVVDAGPTDSTADPQSVDPSLAGNGGAAVGGRSANTNTGSAAVSGGASASVAGSGTPGTNSGGAGGDPNSGTAASGAAAGMSGVNGTAGVPAAGSGAAGGMSGTAGQSGNVPAACPAGQHLCDTTCASDTSPNSCGAACMPCPVPSGGSAECVAGECKPKCSTGQKICLGSCIAETRACEGQCPAGTHDCSGNCVDTLSPMNCGTSCRACAVPSGGTATCDGSSCGIRCGGSLAKACTDHCAAQCCTDNDCGGNDTCVNGSCVCQKQCSGRMCGADGCGGSCGPCPTNYTCTSAGQCDCQERCDGTTCGPNTDGCGGSCTCSGGRTCVGGACQMIPGVYDSCTPNSGSFGPGNCANGFLCVGVGGTGNFCYETALNGICANDYFPAFNTICLKVCNPTLGSPGCPAKTHCIVNGETGGTDPTLGYCIAGS